MATAFRVRGFDSSQARHHRNDLSASDTTNPQSLRTVVSIRMINCKY